MEADLAAGSVIAGYRIDGRLAQGGMGVVYRARHVALDLPVALKLIRPERAHDASYRERFKREARMAASLHHPNVICPQDFGEYENQLYVVMPLIDATDLAMVITDTGPLATGRAATIVEEIAGALGAAHEAGLIHRDVKPANILIAPQREGGERALLTDFGVARAVVSETHLTQADQLPGTPGYVSPEQIQGAAVDQRSDIYSLGCVLCEALTGTVPYPRNTPALMLMAHISEDPPRVSERAAGVPEAFDAVVRQALAKDPDERFATAADLAVAVHEAAARERAATALEAPPPPLAETPAPPAPAIEVPTGEASGAWAPPPAIGAADGTSPSATATSAGTDPGVWTERTTYETGGRALLFLAPPVIAAAVGAVAGVAASELSQEILLHGDVGRTVAGFTVMTLVWVAVLALATSLARRPPRPIPALLGALVLAAVLGAAAGLADTASDTRLRLELFYPIVGVAAGLGCGVAARSGAMCAVGAVLGAAVGLVVGAVRTLDATHFIRVNTFGLTVIAIGVGLAYALVFRPAPR